MGASLLDELLSPFLRFEQPLAAVMATAEEQFDKIDAARCGSVSIQELQLARDSGHLPGVADRQVGLVVLLFLLRKTEAESGRVTRADYLRLLRSLHSSGHRLSELGSVAFDLFDCDASGFLETSELRLLVRVVTGVDASDEQLAQILQQIDSNRDGKVSKAELLAAFGKSGQPLKFNWEDSHWAADFI